MSWHEGYCVDKSVAKELVWIAASEDVKGLRTQQFDSFGYHVEYECDDAVQKRILAYIDNNLIAYSKVNWL